MPTPAATRIGLALAGGGPEGAIYEIGALRALDEAVDGLDLNQLHVYVGVSAGSFIAANLANQLTPAQMCRAIVKHEPGEHPFAPETFFQPAFGELFHRGARVPRLLAEALLDWARHPIDVGLAGSLLRLNQALPVGVLDNEPIREYLARIYSMKGRTDDFRQLAHKLVVVAAELESGEAVRFGEPGHDHVPISLAVQASGALPGIYPPVEIDGRHYVDGVLLKTLHASVGLDAGAELMLCINPIVPVDLHNGKQGGAVGMLVDRGLPSVLSQTFRTLIYSRLRVGLAAYGSRYEGADVVLLEPRRDDYRMFFTNIFAFSSRKAVCEHAYQMTRRDLLARYDELAPIFARHGLRLRHEVLVEERSLWEGVGIGERPRRGRGAASQTLERLSTDLDRLEQLLRAVPAVADATTGDELAEHP
jgi:predicted acylesterase/phospholipase RssA